MDHILQQIVSNLKANGSLRWATLEGRRHAVVPVSMAGVGVLNGSKGPLFYGEDEHKKTITDWNGKPIIVYHAELEGKEISACSPEIFEQQRVGFVFNATWKGKAVAEAWIDEEKANLVDPRVMKAIITNSKMEVSTGLRVDINPVPGEFNGTAYDGQAINYRPDHLALLPDQIGAYSIADGGGLLVNQKTEDGGLSLGDVAFNPRRVDRMVGNALSFGDIRKRLSELLKAKYPSEKSTDGERRLPQVWVEEVYEKAVVYELESVGNSQLLMLSYSRNGDAVSLGGEMPTQVFSSTVYKAADGRMVLNSSEGELLMTKKVEFDKGAFVSALITNEETAFAEEDRSSLMAMEEGMLKKLEPKPPAKGISDPEAVANAARKGAAQTETPPEKPAKVPTLEELVANASDDEQDAYREMQSSHKREKDSLISVITANAKNEWTKPELATMRLPQLRKIAKLAAVDGEEGQAVVANYAGAVGSSGAPDVEQAPLGMPSWE